eukprot:3936092-Rhodomonas_salina.1
MSSIPSGPARPPVVENLPWMNSSTGLNYINLPGRGLCVAVCDIYCAITDKSRKRGQDWVRDVLKGNESDEFATLIGAKVSGVPTYTGPTWVLTYEECIMFLTFLPRTNSKKYIEFIARQFVRIRAGDQSLHAEIDGHAASDGP